MKKLQQAKIIFLAFGLVFSLVFCGNLSSSFAASNRNLTVFAEPNMAIALTKIAHEFSRKNDATISVNFNLSPDLINDVDAGEPMDVLLTAHPDLIDGLKNKGLVDVHSAGYITKDSLVLITNKTAETELNKAMSQAPSLEEALKILDQKFAYLLIDQAENSAGKFANDVLYNMNFSNIKSFNKSSEDKSPILAIARKTEGGVYALLLTSQIKNKKDFTILAKKDAAIFYQALVIAGDNMELGREFVKFLRSDAAKKIFVDAGFNSLDKN
jgi:molybdate transport system substrate-binding protein